MARDNDNEDLNFVHIYLCTLFILHVTHGLAGLSLPTVACLYNPYSFNFSECVLARFGGVFLSPTMAYGISIIQERYYFRY